MNLNQSTSSSRLWRDARDNRFFLIPNDDPPPNGALTLKSITGRKIRVDPDAVADYRVDRAVALEWMTARLHRGLGEFRESTIDWLKCMFGGKRKQTESDRAAEVDDRIPLSLDAARENQRTTTDEKRRRLAGLLDEFAELASKRLREVAGTIRSGDHKR